MERLDCFKALESSEQSTLVLLCLTNDQGPYHVRRLNTDVHNDRARLVVLTYLGNPGHVRFDNNQVTLARHLSYGCFNPHLFNGSIKHGTVLTEAHCNCNVYKLVGFYDSKVPFHAQPDRSIKGRGAS